MIRRIVIVAVARNARGEYLICKMPDDRGDFPGQWGLPGGEMADGERMDEALRRVMLEDAGLEVTDIVPLFFTDDLREKAGGDGQRRSYVIQLFFECWVPNERVKLSPRLEDHAWASAEDLPSHDLNAPTLETFRQLGVFKE